MSKLRPRNALRGLDLPSCCPREKMYQFLIVLYEYVIPASLIIESSTSRCCVPRNCTKVLTSRKWLMKCCCQLLVGVFDCIQDLLTSLDRSLSMFKVFAVYATYFMDMCDEKHSWIHMTACQNFSSFCSCRSPRPLPVVLQDLLATVSPEVLDCANPESTNRASQYQSCPIYLVI